jgi:hypothetical protein
MKSRLVPGALARLALLLAAEDGHREEQAGDHR